MRIAVVDDHPGDRRRIAELALAACEALGQGCTVAEYGSGEAFLSGYAKGACDVLFLDIYLTGMDGLEVARHLRTLDRDLRLVLVTVNNAFAVDGYDVQASGYLVKPVQAGRMRTVLRSCVPDRRPVPSVDVKMGHQNYKVPFSVILYVKKSGNALQVHTTGGVLTTYRSFARFAPLLLCDERFVQCYYGCLANLQHVRRLEEDRFVLQNGALVPLRKKNRSAIRAAWVRYEAGLIQGGGQGV